MNKIKPISIPLTHKNRRVHLLSGLLSLTFFFSVTLFWSLLHIMYTPHPPISHSGSPVRLQGRGGIVRSDGWLSTFCCLPLCTSEIYTAADYQAWKPISRYIPLACSLLFPLCYPSIYFLCLLLPSSIILSFFVHWWRTWRTSYIYASNQLHSFLAWFCWTARDPFWMQL